MPILKKGNHPDYILLIVVAALVLSGILIISSVSTAISLEKFGNTYSFLVHQLVFGILPGIISFFIFYKIPLSFLKKWALIFLLLNLALLTMVFLPKIGASSGGATRWLSWGQFSFQPSEFLKLTFILYLAAWLAGRVEKEKRANLIAFLMVLILVSLLLYFQPDISTLGTIIFVATLMYFLANTPLWHSFFIILAGTGGLLVLIKVASYRMNRLLVFLKPETDPLGIGYQIKQALIAAGSGGIFGLGLGMSRQKFGFLPQTMSDSIFAVFSEEMGFIGAFFLIFLFLFFLWRGFEISKKTKNKFAQLLSLGITSWIVLQAFIHIGSMIGILPLTGSPLSFISYGGSHLIAELAGVGILLNISKNS
jgi:cell division protein FtsW